MSNIATQTVRQSYRSVQCQTGIDLVCYTVYEETGRVKISYPQSINQEGKFKPKAIFKSVGSNTGVDPKSQEQCKEEEYLKKEYIRVMKDVKEDLRRRPSINKMIDLQPTKKVKLRRSLLKENCSPLGLP